MFNTPQLQTILKDSAYKLTQFSDAQIQALENSIIIKQVRDKAAPYVVCLVRGKEIKLTPEEVVRQLFIDTLNKHYGYSLDRIQCEYPVKTGSSSKRADIVVFDADNPTQPYIIVELKQPNVKDGQEQLKSYCRFEGAPLGVWTNGADIEFFLKNQNVKSKTVRLDGLSGLPTANQTLAQYLHTPFTIKDLIINDKLERRSLKEIITQFEDVVLANSGADSFEEIFKLIFTKLFDEFQSGSDKDEINALLKHGTPIEAINGKDFRPLQFRSTSLEEDAEKREAENKKHLEKLFAEARKKWRGIFPADDSFKLTASHLSTCVSYLQDIKLFNSNLEVIDDAFEYLVNQESKGNKGQYFTPRYVIDMCVKMMNPQAHESMIDTAAGSCGFPMHTIFHVWQGLAPENTNLFTTDKRTPAQIEYVQNKVFGIDFDARSVRVGRALNLIAGDGQTNVLRLNTLDYKRWDETVKEQSWINIYNDGFVKLNDLAKNSESYKEFEFDVLMANPPFAGDITDEGMLAHYQLGKNTAGKAQSKVGRDILFIERNLDFLKSGGRMAVVLPQGRFNNSSDKYLRDFIAQHCRILAVVGLHGNVFKPHTGTKTSVLFVQKWDAVLCPQVDDYPIFFATMQEPSKDNSGDKIYVTNADGSPVLDSHEHLIVKHDLFNHDGLTQDGIAEAFIEFAKKEKLSFFDLDLPGFKNLEGLYAAPFNEMKYRALLEKLEISEVMLTSLNDDKRFDAEFYDKQSENIKVQLTKKGFTLLGDLAKSITDMGAFSLYRSEYFVEKGVPFLRVNNVKNNFLDLSDVIFISNEYHNILKKSQVRYKDVLLTTKAIIGMSCTVEKDVKECNMSQNLVRIVVNEKIINPFFLSTFLNSKYGKTQTVKSATGNVQLYLNFEKIKAIKIPKVSAELQNSIQKLIEESEDKRKDSKNNYAQAENLLFNALDMADFSPSTENVNIKSFKDSFLTTGRLDAEYYQPKYDEILFSLKTNNFDSLKNLAQIQKGVQARSEEKSSGFLYASIKDCNNYSINTTERTNEKTVLVEPNSLVFAITGATIGKVAINNTNEPVAISGDLIGIKPKAISPFYLLVVLSSPLIQEFCKKDITGATNGHLSIQEFSNYPIPLVDSEIQTKIASLIQQSFSLKATSENLLETAKRAVEIAIETDEQTAMAFINSHTGE